MKKNQNIIFYFILFVSGLVYSQNPSFVASVSKNKVEVNEPFTISFVLSGTGGNVTLPSLDADFNIVGGPNQSNSFSSVNGVNSQATTISIFLTAKHTGAITIGAASVKSGNSKLETKPITIEVVKVGAGSGATAVGNTGNQKQNIKESNGQDLFVKSFVNKSNAYLGEQIILTQKVYSRLDLRGFQKVEFPSYNGFWSQTQNNSKQIELHQETINGLTYYVATYHTVYLFPQQVGQISIEPITLECVVRRQSSRQPRDLFEQFFGGGFEDAVVAVKSKLVNVNIQELPIANKPLEFNGAVGNFSAKIDINHNKIKANEAITLKLTISGSGNIKLVEPINLNLPSSFEIFEPKITENINSNDGVSGTKTFEYLIIPREKGEFVIKNVAFSYFNPTTQKYNTISIPEFKILVLPGSGNQNEVSGAATKNEISETAQDIRYIFLDDLNLQLKSNELFFSSSHITSLLLIIFLFIGSLIALTIYKNNNKDISKVNERKASKVAHQQLFNAKKMMEQNNADLFFAEILKALHLYITHKFSLSITDLSQQKTIELFITKGIQHDTVQNFIDIISNCEMVKYSNQGKEKIDLQNTYQDALTLISKIESQLKKA